MLLFSEHVNNICKKALKASNKISIFLSATNGLNTGNCVNLYKALIRPHLEYAFAVWASIKESNFSKIERINRIALLKATGCLNSTPTAAFKVITNTIPIRLRLQELLATEYIRLLRKNDNHPLKAIALGEQHLLNSFNPQLILPSQMMHCDV